MKAYLFLSGFSLKDTDSQDSRGREETIFYSILPLPPAHKHSDIYLQLCMWDDYHIFLIAPLVFTRLLLDEIYHLIELPFDWWCDVKFCLFTCWFDSRFLLQLFDMVNRWTRTRIDYHHCITSEPTNRLTFRNKHKNNNSYKRNWKKWFFIKKIDWLSEYDTWSYSMKLTNLSVKHTRIGVYLIAFCWTIIFLLSSRFETITKEKPKI